MVSTHSHPKVAAQNIKIISVNGTVSTHSHPKVAAQEQYFPLNSTWSFNTQPPEGGCFVAIVYLLGVLKVSTHSHPKVAAPYIKKQDKSAN